MKITCVGTGFVGLSAGACLANLGHEVTCLDINQERIDNLHQGIMPFFEPGLKELVEKNVAKHRLHFTTNSSQAIAFADILLICVGTPCKENGAADLSYIFSAVDDIKKFAQGYKLLVIKSTVPPGTAKACQELLEGTQVEVASNPEFQKQGAAVHDFMHPDKIVLGAQSQKAFDLLHQMYSGLERPYLNIIETTWESAELIKYANNSFLATKISFINEVANIADTVGADIKVIAKALGMDYRINPKFLNAGIGYGGSCFPKDVRALVQVGKEKGYEPKLLQEVDAFNERQKLEILKKVYALFGEDLQGVTLSLWGLAFKPKTSDLRGAPSLQIIKELLARGAALQVYDPVAMPEAKKLYAQVTYCTILSETVQASSAILLLTEWDEFRNVSLQELGQHMKKKYLFDGRNVYTPQVVRDAGFSYEGIGRR